MDKYMSYEREASKSKVKKKSEPCSFYLTVKQPEIDVPEENKTLLHWWNLEV